MGHARTFAAAWQRARATGGTLAMRMEDLDPDRSRSEYAEAALEDLRWLGLDWDEGPDVGGPYAPYTQSARRAVYRAAMQRLVEGGFVYPCRCTRKDLAAALSAPHEGAELDDEPVYPGTCRAPLREADSWTRESAGEANWRFRVPDGEAVDQSEEEGGEHNAAHPPAPKDEGGDGDVAAPGGDVVDVLPEFADRQVRAGEPTQPAGGEDRQPLGPRDGQAGGGERRRRLADSLQADAAGQVAHVDVDDDGRDECQVDEDEDHIA